MAAYSHHECFGTAYPSRRHLARLSLEAQSAYWIRFLNGRWLVYWHERLIGDFPAENAVLALTFLRQKQSERATNTSWPTPRTPDRDALSTATLHARPDPSRIPPPAHP